MCLYGKEIYTIGGDFGVKLMRSTENLSNDKNPITDIKEKSKVVLEEKSSHSITHGLTANSADAVITMKVHARAGGTIQDGLDLLTS